MRTSRLVGAFLLLCFVAGCGARTEVTVGPPEATRDGGVGTRDGGRGTRDGGRRDGGARDAGVDAGGPSEACTLSPIAGPTLIGRESPRFVADVPQAAVLFGRYYLLHAMRDTRRDAVVPFGNPFDETLTPVGGLAAPLGRMSEPYRVAAMDDRLGYCFGAGDTIALVTDASPPEAPGTRNTRNDLPTRGSCRALAANNGQFLAGMRIESFGADMNPAIALLDARGALLTMPEPAFQLTSGEGRDITITATSAGSFAFTGHPDRRGVLEVGLVGPGGEVRRFTIDGVPFAQAPPAIALWPFGDQAIAIVTHGPSGVYAIVIDTDRGAELLRTEAFAFSMGGDVTPAVAAIDGGLIVAMLNYGDADPQGGMLDITVLDALGREGGHLIYETRRDGSLSFGGIDAATDGRYVALHWAESDESDPAGPAPQTKAMLLGCFFPD